ncbi:MAG: hypothetical protein MI924_09070 [Chloroflexales bacterium]|nr:hypothetical protein [Chloroflexales bacterium]
MVFVGNGAEGEFEELTEGPLWQSLPAVQAGNAYPVSSILNISYYGALYTFEQRANMIAGEEQEALKRWGIQTFERFNAPTISQ